MSHYKSSGLYMLVLLIAVFSTPLADAANWNPLVETGVYYCMDDSGTIQCPSESEPYHGQDAQYFSMGQHYYDNQDGTVTDVVTGLLWQALFNADKDWSESTAYCSQLDFAGHQDWRLPEIFEWVTLIDYSKSYLVFQPELGTVRNQVFWSATPLAGDSSQAWTVTSTLGQIRHHDISEKKEMKCVRGENKNPGIYVDKGLTVTETLTFLTWQKTDDGQDRDWEQALAYCESLELDAKNDWRLPNAKELFSLVDYKSIAPSISGAYFTVDMTTEGSSRYWSSTPYPIGDIDNVEGVNFVDGISDGGHPSTATGRTRCVRDGLIRHPHLSVTLAGTGDGSVQGATVPGGIVIIDCGSDCSEDPAHGDIVSLTATTESGSSFVRWAGDFVGEEDCEGDSGVCTLQMFEDTVITAYFMPHKQLTVSKDGIGAGFVVSSPAGIFCGDGTGGDCDQYYDFGTDVTLSAVPASGSVFWYWTGEGCSGNGECIVNMDRTKSVTATFRPFLTVYYHLTITTSGNGKGNITSFPEGIDCDADDAGGAGDCTRGFPVGTEVTLTASTGPSSAFTGWSGFPCTSGTSPTCLVTMDRTWAEQGAEFTQDTTSERQLTVTIQDDALGHSGSVSSSPSGISCGRDCTELYAYKEVVTLTATADSDASFVGWSGDVCTGSDPECIVPMTNSWQVTANFGPASFKKSLTVTKDGNGRGTVTSKLIEGIDCGADCSEVYPQNTAITLIAKPATGTNFIGWSGDCNGTGDCQITLSSNTTVNATFEFDPAMAEVFKDGFETE